MRQKYQAFEMDLNDKLSRCDYMFNCPRILRFLLHFPKSTFSPLMRVGVCKIRWFKLSLTTFTVTMGCWDLCQNKVIWHHMIWPYFILIILVFIHYFRNPPSLLNYLITLCFSIIYMLNRSSPECFRNCTAIASTQSAMLHLQSI